MEIALGGFWTVADLLRQQQAFWQLPALVLVSEGGQGGRGGSYVWWVDYYDDRLGVFKPHGGGIDFGLDPAKDSKCGLLSGSSPPCSAARSIHPFTAEVEEQTIISQVICL